MAITDLNVTNQAVSTTTGAINNTDDPVTFSVASGDGNLKFPSTAGGKYFYVVVVDGSANFEIMKVTSRTGDSMTADRAQQGTTIRSFLAGAAVEMRVTAEDFNDITAMLATLRSDIDGLEGALGSIQVFVGSGTWTKPANLKFIRVRGQAPGGGGGGADATTAGQGACGAGGGAGGYFEKMILAASLGATETVTINAVGSGGVGGAAGSGGGSVSFGGHCSATGGGGGSWAQAGAPLAYATGGLGGSATGGDVNIDGGGGAHGTRHGTSASSLGLAAGGAGGSGVLGGGARGIYSTATGNAGDAGGDYGGGGGGAANGESQGNRTGGAGGLGIIIVEEYS